MSHHASRRRFLKEGHQKVPFGRVLWGTCDSMDTLLSCNLSFHGTGKPWAILLMSPDVSSLWLASPEPCSASSCSLCSPRRAVCALTAALAAYGEAGTDPPGLQRGKPSPTELVKLLTLE